MKINMFADAARLKHAMNYHLDRHAVLGSNLSQVSTPGYRPKDLVYNAPPADGDVESKSPWTRAASFELVEQESEPPGTDGNSVRLERAMSQLAANRMRYEMAVDIARRNLGMLKYAALDGER